MLGIIGGVLVLCCCGCGGVSWAFQTTLKGLVGMGDAIAKDLGKDGKVIDKGKGVTNDADKDKGKPPPLLLKADFSMKAQKLGEELDKNLDAATKKYTGKNLEIIGELKELGFFGSERKLGVSLDAGFFDGADNLVNVPIQPADHAKVYRLSKGQTVKIVAPFSGKAFRFISFETGYLSEVSKSTIVETTSEDLSAAYAKDSLSADQKFRDKTLLVTGQVLELSKDKRDQQIAKLKSSNKLTVTVVGNALGSLEVDKLAKGKTAVIRVDHLNFVAGMNEIVLSQIAVAEVK